jgi:hypothetical protein
MKINLLCLEIKKFIKNLNCLHRNLESFCFAEISRVDGECTGERGIGEGCKNRRGSRWKTIYKHPKMINTLLKLG